MTMTAPPDTLAPRRSALERSVAMRLAATEYQRVADHLRTLTPEQWDAPTECPGWSVRDVAGHLLGMARMAASLREQQRQVKTARRIAAERGCLFIDALTGIQVDDHRGLTNHQVLDAYLRTAPKAVRGRKRTPGFIHRRPMPISQHVKGREESWTVGFLVDTILTRDPWMHRVDIARATGTELLLTPEHDGVIVDDVVREWADRHGGPVHLRLTGPAGGEWSFGSNGGAPAAACSPVDGGPSLELDAVEFCLLISGRGDGATGLLTWEVPF